MINIENGDNITVMHNGLTIKGTVRIDGNDGNEGFWINNFGFSSWVLFSDVVFLEWKRCFKEVK